MKIFITNIIIAGIFFFLGCVCCWVWGTLSIGKIQMYIDPQGNGTLLLKDNHLVGLATNKEDSFDIFFQDLGFRFYFFHSSPDLSFQSVDFNGDGIPERIYVENENKDKIERLIHSIAIECSSP